MELLATAEEERKWEEERNAMEGEFPNLKFDVCLDKSELDDVICTGRTAAIKVDYKCRCYGWRINGNTETGWHYTRVPDVNWIDRPTEYYYCHNSGRGITKRDIIKQMEIENHDPECDHNFLEHIGMDTEGQVGLWWGS